jgi:signal transduction histidine kinase
VPDGFDVFELLKTKKPAGTVLGLSAVQKIISAPHNETIDLAGDPVHGTTFTIRLPIPD